jgi:hypothetical protein
VKRRTTKVKETPSSDASTPRFSEEQVLSVIMSIPEVKESLSPADALLAAEDVGWVSLREGGDGLELAGQRREQMVKTCRLFWRQDPLAKQAVRLWTDYAVGTGITFNSTDKKVLKNLTSFWCNRKNKRLTSSRGQQRLSKKLLVDGEVFFAVFGGEDENKVIRTIDPLQVKDIICDPEDEEEILCYKRVDRGSPSKTRYYKDWAADDAKLEDLKDPEDKKTIVVEEDVVVYHVPFDDLGKRGNSLLSAVVGWTHEHRKFMEARVSLIRALARFAWKVTAKGGQKTIDKIQKDLNSSLSSGTGSRERNPPAAAGSTWAQNQGVDMEPMPRSTGASDAGEDSRNLRLMFCAGTGTFPHYYGDGRDANLATATAMELPMLKEFTGFQELWKDVWRDLFSIVLGEDIDEEPTDIQVSLPAMLQDDLGKLGIFLEGLHGVFPEIGVPEILQLCLVAIGVNNVPEVMKSMAAHRTQLAAQNNSTPPVTGKQPPQKTPATEAAKIKAMNRLSKTLKEVFAA